MAKKGEQLKVCRRGHDDWVYDPRSGYRRCNTCHLNRERERRNRDRRHRPPSAGWSDPAQQGNRGPREETFTYTEIMKARGYAKT